MNTQALTLSATSALLLSSMTPALAQGSSQGSSQGSGVVPQRVRVTIENLAPGQGTFQTPFWVGFHDGTFDTYTGGVPASGPNALLPFDALERIAEDGNTGPIMQAFATLPGTAVDRTVPGPNGPIAPGDRAMSSFLLDPTNPEAAYFSYASMILPSNDAFIANGSPVAHRMFDDNGMFIASDFFVGGNEINDAGTEVNDEIPMNTAFFGQMAPDTGVEEGGVVFNHLGFNARGTGGILDDFRYRNADFLAPGYPLLRFQFRSAPAITEDKEFVAGARAGQTVPQVTSPGIGRAFFRLRDQGTRLRVGFDLRNASNVTMAHLHIGGFGETGPVVMSVYGPFAPGGGEFSGPVFADFTADNLTCPLAGYPLDELARLIGEGQIYFNVHTDDGVAPQNTGPGDFATGEIRGQLFEG
ncbi:MAG: spondin domain-containing protein [Planctomycetota bacterium]